ncbi:3-hydroxyisobutyrate dehydrogenase [Aquisalinus flavus]|uniref:3-hydroxyisobutyrate dehydrogenase n=1 Tax=Aquisalinus flavus TaxID=1526572 RepID=A0A8J2V2C1_9PROT|nr:3-hydroxyisobutyrate dehydrogenase [Aquisalinus flavus]MBD0425207.1 3-hydroxyisobutyrate dehydrogenase [Aquisalinus flavus]UNE49131.1 3-hydroxyisobutyrate dehydrogenase [Aquisalinus flavus]GGD17895.1 3-hydroxyisobutyrate dehydrogenase [Aquisalinus flavus]
MKILFIGLGHMGSGMAANLARAGHDVIAHDLSDAAVQRAVEAGCRAADGLAGAAGEAEAVISMLPAGRHVRDVYLGEAGIATRARQGTLFIDCSTIDGDSAIAVGEGAKARGFAFVDAPVSGGTAAAEAGTLTFMVGGSTADFERAKEVLGAMGKNIFHAGGVGAGQAAKICNNMLLAISMIGTCEAFNLAEKLGLDAQTFFDISSKASGQCWSMTSYCPAPGPVPGAPSNRDYQPGFAAAMMLKDLRLAHNAAEKAKAATPLGTLSESLYTMMEAAGTDDLDFSGVMKLIRGDLKA